MYAQCVTYAREHLTPDKQAGRAAQYLQATSSASGHRASGALMRRRTSRSRPTPEQDQGEQHSLRHGVKAGAKECQHERARDSRTRGKGSSA